MQCDGQGVHEEGVIMPGESFLSDWCNEIMGQFSSYSMPYINMNDDDLGSHCLSGLFI